MELSTFSIIIIVALTMLFVFVLLPSIFNQIKKLWYWKKNSGPNGVHREGMVYNAKKGRLEATNTPIH